MSDLYAKLKTIAAQSPKAPPSKALCQIREKWFVLEEKTALCPEEVASLCALEGIKPVDPEHLLFLDTETTGLGGGAGTLAFLVGIGWYEDGRFFCRQYWLASYEQEQDLLEKVLSCVENKTLVTFNGKTFDVPLLQGRCVMNRLRMREIPHIDLLSHARKIFRLRMKRVPLTALEQELLGQTRQDDLPGAEVPGRFFQYLDTGEISLLDDVFRHNAQDIFSLSRLAKCIANAYQQPLRLEHGEDIFCVGRVFEKCGNLEKARTCYCLSKKQYHLGSVLALSYLEKREKSFDAAISGFLQIAGQSPQACVELAKYYEHQTKQLDLALFYTDQAIMQTKKETLLAPLIKRRNRILSKINRKKEREHGFSNGNL